MAIDQEVTNMNQNNSNFLGKARLTTLSHWGVNIFTGIIIATLSFNVAAEPPLHYYDDGNQRTIKLQPSLVADFSTNTSPQIRSTESVETKPFVTLQQNTSPVSRTAGSVANQSPVFREGDSPAGRLMALPGGVIVNFKPDWTDDQIQLWAKAHGYLIEQKLNILGNWYVIHTAPGLVSLQTANDIQESGEVITATPNWWKQTVTR
ncbi:MAG: hypothetical protein ACXV8Q_03490 [Methylobacter sp.]